MVERHWCKALDCILMVFMYCYYHKFMCVCWLSRRRPQNPVHAITFELLLDFFQFWHDCWPWPIDYLIRFWSIFVVTLTLNFKVKYGICYISAINGPIATKRKANISIEPKASNVTIWVWLWPWPWPWIFKVKYGICYISTKSGPKVRYKDLPDSDRGDFRCRRAVDSSSCYLFHWQCLRNKYLCISCHP